VKRSQFLATLAASVLLVNLAIPGAVAQRPMAPVGGAAGSPASIAVLDVSYVFKNHARFKALMAQMQADVDGAEAEVKKERDGLKALSDRLAEHQAGSPDYKQLEEELARRQSQLAVRVQLQKKDFLQREAKIYYTVYQELMQEVDYYAANNGISMVLRFNGDPVDVQKPEDVLRQINQPIIWFPKDRDITPMVLERLNGRGPAAGQPAQRPGVPPLR
jgi:Skp family chaperone for outer membrane proteins